jgi:hypothetical protein
VYSSPRTVLAQSEIERVLQQGLVVRADVEHDRQTVLRRHAGQCSTKREFADRDAHPAGAEIAKPKDALTVRDNNEPDVRFGPIEQQLLQPTPRGDRQIDAARLTKDMAEFLARLAHRRRIHDRHVGRWIRHQHGVEQRLVPCLKVGQHQIFQQVVVEISNLGMSSRHLQFDARYGGRQQTFQPPGLALRHGECRPLVQARVVQQAVACRMIAQRCVHGHFSCV